MTNAIITYLVNQFGVRLGDLTRRTQKVTGVQPEASHPRPARTQQQEAIVDLLPFQNVLGKVG